MTELGQGGGSQGTLPYILFFLFLFSFSISIFPIKVVGKVVGTYNFDRENRNKNRKDTLYRTQFYIRPIYQVSPYNAESTVNI